MCEQREHVHMNEKVKEKGYAPCTVSKHIACMQMSRTYLCAVFLQHNVVQDARESHKCMVIHKCSPVAQGKSSQARALHVLFFIFTFLFSLSDSLHSLPRKTTRVYS